MPENVTPELGGNVAASAPVTVTNPDTEGLSPKAIAALVASLVTTYVVGLLAKLLGAEVEIDTLVVVVGPIVLALITFAFTYAAKVGKVLVAKLGGAVVPVQGDATGEAGESNLVVAGAVCGILALILVAVLLL